MARHIATSAIAALVAAGALAETPAPLSDEDFPAATEAQVELGRLLFFDPVLSGNRDVACGTCHDPRHGTSDGLPLGLGTGAHGFGPERRGVAVTARVPRNAPALWNVGHRDVRSLFHDGRVEPDPTRPSGFWTPAREALPEGLASVLAAQAMFPVLSSVEMAGRKGENEVATAVAEDRPRDAWDHLAARLAAIPGYAARFEEAFEDVRGPQDVTFVHAANALAAFQARAFRSDGAPFDDWLAGGALPEEADRGAALFYGRAGCSGCHAGALLTDGEFHAAAVPQIGPGKGHGQDTTYWRASGFPDRLEDEGRYRVSFEPGDLFAFRTPSLRNVELTAPYGHSGAIPTLEAAIRHMADPLASLEAARTPALPEAGVIEATGRGSALIFRPLNPARRRDWDARDGWVQGSAPLRARIAAASEIAPVALSDAEVAEIAAFLRSLTDPSARDRSHLIPAAVPSGLPPQPTPDGDAP